MLLLAPPRLGGLEKPPLVHPSVCVAHPIYVVGNWQEELALEKATGFARCAQAKTPGYYKNHERVMAHTDCVDPKTYQSTAHAAMSQQSRVKAKPPSTGPREDKKRLRHLAQARAEAAAKEEARDEINAKINYETNTQASQSHMPSSLSRLSNPHTSNKLYGGEVTRRSLADGDIPNLPPGVYSDATAVTYWTSQLTNPDKITDFPITAGNSSNPFTRSSAFTNDIRDGRLHHAEGADFGGVEPSGLGRDRSGISEQLVEDFHSGSSFPTW